MSEPTISGPFARAWLVPNTSTVPDHQAGIVSWIVNCPGAHPFWQHWMVACCSLRDIPGVRPAIKHYPEAEYEFLIMTINPETHPKPTPEMAAKEGLQFLDPPDVVEQFHGITEQDVARLCEGAIRAICNGHVSPDQDYRRVWKSMIHTTVQHFREGKHPLS